MKKRALILFTIGLNIIGIYGCHSNQPELNNENVLAVIQEFYSNYIIENSKMPTDFKKIKQLKEKYCTANLLLELENAELDYDPFLDAQDSDSEWLKTLTIKRSENENNVYFVSYKSTYTKSDIIIKLYIVKYNDTYKIDKIL